MNSIKQNNSNDHAPLRRDSPFYLVEEDTMSIGAMETTNDTSHQVSANSSQEAKTQIDIDSETNILFYDKCRNDIRMHTDPALAERGKKQRYVFVIFCVFVPSCTHRTQLIAATKLLCCRARGTQEVT